MSIVIGVALFMLGGFIGVATMCIVQVGATAERNSESIRYEETKK